MFTPIDHLPMAEPCGQVLTIYVDAIGKLEILEPGVNVRVTYVEVRLIGGIRYRVPILEIVRPRVWCDTKYWQRLMAQAEGPQLAIAH